MRLKLPHSQVAYDLAEAQEVNDNFIAIQRALNRDFLDELDIKTGLVRFTIPLQAFYAPAFPADLGIKLPVSCTVERAYFSSTWGPGPAGSLTLRPYIGTEMKTTISLTPAAPTSDTVTAWGWNAGLPLSVRAFAGGVPPVSLIGWGVTFNCKALVEVT